jgi:hypothetical protein
MGLYHGIRRQLASAYVGVPHGRYAVFRHGFGVAPPHQPPAARSDEPAALPAVPARNGVALAQCAGGRAVCCASAPRRVGRLGGRTQRRAERLVLGAGARRLRRVRASARIGALWTGRSVVCARASVQTHGRDAALRAAADGRVATRPMARRPSRAGCPRHRRARAREGRVVPDGGRVGDRDVHRAASGRRRAVARRLSARASCGQCAGCLCPVPRGHDLARGACAALPVPGVDPALAEPRRRGAAGGHHDLGGATGARRAVSHRGMVVVPRDARAGHRPRAGGISRMPIATCACGHRHLRDDRVGYRPAGGVASRLVRRAGDRRPASWPRRS